MPKKKLTKEQTKAKAAKRMRKIMKIAKQIRRDHPTKTWRTCVKEAGAQYKAGKASK